MPIAVLVPLGPGNLDLQVATLLDATTAVAIEIVALRLAHGALVREIRAAFDLENESAKLAASEARLTELNESLERRVSDQVGEIRRHAREVERLNIVLQERVRTNAVALADALQRLGEERVTIREGAVLDGRFELTRRLGAGAMGVVYEGLDRETREPIAVKLMESGLARDGGAVQRFVREALAAASVRHPAIVRTEHIAFTDQGALFQVQELVRGVSFDELLAPRRTLSERDAAAIAHVLADALAAAHAAGITHRDVKPSNVMLSREERRVCLLDFGVAKLRESPASLEQTESGVVVGTPAYLAPEAVLDVASIGPAVDVYALGVLLYRVVVGRVPFERDGIAAVLAAHALEPLPDLADLGLSVAMRELLAEMMRKAPAQRPSADRARDRLRALAAGTTTEEAIERAFAADPSGAETRAMARPHT